MMAEEKSIFHARPSILASVEGSPLVQAVNPKFLDWLLKVEDDYTKKAEKLKAMRALANALAPSYMSVRIMEILEAS